MRSLALLSLLSLPLTIGCGPSEQGSTTTSDENAGSESEAGDNTTDATDSGDSGNESQTSGSQSGDDSETTSTNTSDEGLPDGDNDGLPDDSDNCPDAANKDQADGDNDGVGDACDACPDDPEKSLDPGCGCGETDTDGDRDGVFDCVDNCVDIPNADQEDIDKDGKGDGCACDPKPMRCDGGMADGKWPCEGMDLVSNLTPAEMGLERLNDNWGWTDPETGHELAIVCGYDGAAFVDIHHPYCPRPLGKINPVAGSSIWADAKIFKNYVYIVNEDKGSGIQVFDLTRLRAATGAMTWEPDNVIMVGHVHNVAINVDSGHLYTVLGEDCEGGIAVFDLNEEPGTPKKIGCWSEKRVHDVQCVIYRGPDAEWQGKEVCIASTDASLDMSIIDMSDPTAPKSISSDKYPGGAYSHQGWMTEDHRYYLHGDELDEGKNGHPTHTYLWDISDLDSPKYLGVYESPINATDHNRYVHNGLVYEANYRGGLRVLDPSEIASGKLAEIAYFDTYPADDSSEMGSAWSNYPFFESGNILITAMNEGLFVVRHSDKIADEGGFARTATTRSAAK